MLIFILVDEILFIYVLKWVFRTHDPHTSCAQNDVVAILVMKIAFMEYGGLTNYISVGNNLPIMTHSVTAGLNYFCSLFWNVIEVRGHRVDSKRLFVF